MRGGLAARSDWLAHMSRALHIAYTQSHLTKLILLLQSSGLSRYALHAMCPFQHIRNKKLSCR